MIKVLLFFFLFTSSSHSYYFRLPPENPVPEKFDQFIFDNSLKTVIMTNLYMLKQTNQKICAASECKYLLKSPNIVEIYIGDEIISIELEMKN